MAEGVCSRKRAKVIVIALAVVCVVAAIIGIIVYVTRDKGDDETGTGGSSGSDKIYRLPSSLKPQHYELQLAPDIYQTQPPKFGMAGQVVIRVLCQEVTSVINLHAVGLQIFSDGMKVTLADDATSAGPGVKSWELDPSRDILSLHLDSPLKATHSYHIHLKFQAPLTEKFQSAYYSSYMEMGETKYLAATIFVPTYARMAFPCFDEPALKAEFTLTLLRKANFIGLSNMPLNRTESRTVDGEAWVADTFQKSPPMSTYLLTFTVCQFQSQEANTTRGYTFKAWSRPESIQETAYALQVGTKVMPFFDDYFGIQFPLPEQEMIALPEFQYGGMEHWGLVGYKERTLLYSNLLPSPVDKQRIATIIAHELGHMWFGDLLTMVWWDDTWLNEGFASYVQYLGINHAFPAWKMLDQFLTNTFRLAMSIDAFEYSRPLYVPVVKPRDALAAYDRIIYYKGASVIRMVRSFLGEATFRRGIQRYLRKFQYSSASHEDLWNSLYYEAKADGIQVNISDVMHGWTMQNNYPVVMVTRNHQGRLTVSQQRYLLKPGSSYDQHTWDIPFTFATSSTHRPDQDVSPDDVTWLVRHQKQTNIDHASVPDPTDTNQWVLGNVGCHGYYRVNYDENNWRALIKQLKTNLTKIATANRAQILMDAWSLAKAGQLNYAVALDTLGYLQNETRFLPWRTALLELADLKHILTSNLTVYQRLSTFMQRQTSSVFDEFDPNTALQEDLDARTPMLVAKTACQYGLPACVSMAKTQFAQWRLQPANNAINVDLRSMIYCTGIAHGNRSEWDFVFNQYMAESMDNERTRLRLALACSRDTATLNTLINRTLDSKYIRGQDALETLIVCAGNLHGRPLVWKFVRDNLPVIIDRFGGTAFNVKGLFSGITRSFHTTEELEQLEDLTRQNPDIAASMTDAIAQTRANVQWVRTNMGTVEDWLILQNAQASATD